MEFNKWRVSLIRNLKNIYRFSENEYRIDGTTNVIFLISGEEGSRVVNEKIRIYKENNYRPFGIMYSEDCEEGSLKGCLVDCFNETNGYDMEEDIALIDFLEREGLLHFDKERYVK